MIFVRAIKVNVKEHFKNLPFVSEASLIFIEHTEN